MKFMETIGTLTFGLIVILMLSQGFFVDELQAMSRYMVGGWDGIRGTAEQLDEVYCSEEGCE